MTPEERILKAHVGPDNLVWHIEGDHLPQCSGQPVEQFICSPACRRHEAARVLGTRANASLLVALSDKKRDGWLGSLEVASPLASRRPSNLLGSPEAVLLDMRSWEDSPSRGGWHQFDATDHVSYSLAVSRDRGDSTETTADLLREHPLWTPISRIPHLDLSQVAELVAEIRDPRFFVDLANPARISRLQAYLGLEPESQRESQGPVTLRQSRFGVVVASWKNYLSEPRDIDDPENFLWKYYYSYPDPRRGELRASQKWIAFLRHVWLDSLYRDKGYSLFVPEYFFTPRQAAWFKEGLDQARR